MIDSLSIIQAVQESQRQLPQGSAGKPMRLAIVDPTYDPFVGWPGPATMPRVTFEGEEELTEQTFAVLNGYVPMASDRVLMIPTGTTYTIVGKVGNPVDVQGFWADADSSGVELGGGSYYSSEEGLVVAQDLEAKGEVHIGPRTNRIPEVQFGSGTISGAGAGTSVTLTVTYPIAWPAGTAVYVIPIAVGVGGPANYTMLRVQNKTVTNFQITAIKTDAARANYDGSTSIPFDWIALARPTG